MDPALLGTRLASGAVAPLVRKLFVRDGPGAGLVERPVRLSALVSFRGEKRALTDRDVRGLAARLIRQAVASPGEPPFPPDEETASSPWRAWTTRRAWTPGCGRRSRPGPRP